MCYELSKWSVGSVCLPQQYCCKFVYGLCETSSSKLVVYRNIYFKTFLFSYLVNLGAVLSCFQACSTDVFSFWAYTCEPHIVLKPGLWEYIVLA